MIRQRHISREIAVSTLYSLDFNNNLPPAGEFDIFQGMTSEEVEVLEDDTKIFASYLVNGTIEHLVEVDDLIKKYSVKRPLEKIDLVDRNILRISFFQLLFDKTTHPTIVIDEAVKLSQDLSNDVSFKFINGILDKYVKEEMSK